MFDFRAFRRKITPFQFVISLQAALVLAFLAAVPTVAQDSLKGATPAGLAPGAPAGSYSLSGFESVNAFSGNLNFNLPIVSVGGRGNAATAISLQIDQKWSVRREVDPVYGNVTNFPDYTDWIKGPRYLGARLEYRVAGNATVICPSLIYGDREVWVRALSRLTITVGDGTEFELRDTVYGGQPKVVPKVGGCPTSTINRGKIFVTADGSAATFVSDSDILDEPFVDPGYRTEVSGYLYLKDGSRWRFAGGDLTEIRDRNGNKLTFAYTGGSVPTTTITDSLNRQVVITRDYTDGTYGLCDKITYKGFGGASRTIFITKTNLTNVLRSGYTLKTYAQLFPSLNGSSGASFNPVVRNALYLPNGKSYQFKYNSYGELARVVLPTGGAIEYDWDVGESGNTDGGVIPTASYMDYGVYRRVLERRVYEDGSTLESKMTYSRATQISSGLQTSVITESRDSSNNLLAKQESTFWGSAKSSFLQQPEDYSKWRDGRELKTEAFASNGSTSLRVTENNFAQRASVSWWSGSSDDAPPNDPRVTDTTNKLTDVSPNLISQTTFTYDQFNNQTDAKEYDYGSGSVGSFVRRTHTDYATSVNGTDYANVSPTPNPSPTATPAQGTIHIRNLPLETRVSSDVNDTVIVSRTQFQYDQYSSSYNEALVNRTSISGHDSSYTTSHLTRGNATAIIRYGNAAASSNAVTSYQRYDIAGNVVKIRDPEGNETSAAYSDSFGAPNGNATTNTSPTELSGVSQTSYAFATSVTNALSQTVYSQFDFYTGMPVDGQDLNGVVTSGYSTSDALDRPTQIIRAVGQTEQSQTTFAYDDTNRKVTTTSDLSTYSDNALKTESFYDGLGRTTETRRYEGSSAYIKTTQTYDPLGRIKRSYNPHRTTSASTDGYAENTYDALGRVTAVTTSDGSVVNTSYSGNTVTVTDQASKQRKNETDALGRLKKVWEPDSGGTLNVNTDYTYDVLNNLTGVSQGSQTRSFTYDSLSRLTAATNPESGTIDYTYDGNGNLLTKIDDNSITTTYTYDDLNRVTNRDYSDSTPDVTYTYDNVTNAIGRLTKVSNSNSETHYTAFDKMGRVTAHKQRQNSTDFTTAYTYNLAGMLLEETYPSGRVVKNTIGSYGDLSQVETKPSGGSFTTRASNFTYSAPGAVSAMQLGNSLWEGTDFNSRLQPTEIKLGTSSGAYDKLRLQYGYGSSSANNGNVMSQTITVPSGFTAYQTYTYDNLNRIATAAEVISGSTTWSQTYGYDRYGNRNITAGTGTTSLSFTDNKITTSGYSYDNVGNLLADPVSGQSYVYDAENKQIQVSNGGGTLGQYLYDGDGKRVKKYNTSPSDNRLFIYDAAGKLIEERSTTGVLAVQKSYVYSGSRLLAVENEKTFDTSYLTADHLGTPRINTDGSANVTARHDYMPFGEEILTALTAQRTSGVGYPGADGIRKQFTGYERDGESGLEFAQARTYANTLGRFSSPDPLMASAASIDPQTFNRYAYVLNMPTSLTDPQGLAPVTGSACGQWCNNGSSYVDGSSFRGRDAAYDDLLSSLSAYATHSALLEVSNLASGLLNGNLVQVVIWNKANPAKEGVSSTFGHVSYIYKGHSWSWEGAYDASGEPDYAYEPKAGVYLDDRRRTSAGTGYILDFGSRELNARFAGELLSAYDGTGDYELLTNNCGHGFQRAVNVMAALLDLPTNDGYRPEQHRTYITGVLQPRGYVVGIKNYPKSTARDGAGGATIRGGMGGKVRP